MPASWRAPANNLLSKLGYRIVRRRIDLLDVLRVMNVDLVIDVGANEGQYGLFLRRRGYFGRIASFEPIPEIFVRLKQICSGDAKWSVHEFALGDYDGSAQLHIAEDTQLSSLLIPTKWNLLRKKEASEARCETITVRRLDTIIDQLAARRPFLKLDVQGAEHLVLRGAKGLLSKLVGIQLEVALYQFYEGQLLLEDTLRLMSNLGFVPAVLYPFGYYDAANPCRLMEMDCVFIPKDESLFASSSS
jgi:FkbM family methyltransferase